MMSDIIDQMLVFEECEVTFQAEKAKILQIERIKSSLENESVPEEYLQVCFDFLIGCFWIRFTPLFDKTQHTIQLLIREHSAKFAPQLFKLLENLNYLTQLAHENGVLVSLFVKPLETSEVLAGSLVRKSYLRDTKLEEDFMDVKDFFYNVGKSLCMATVMEDK